MARHAHLRAAGLSCNLLVVDEVPASDAYIRHILKALLGAGGYALLISAALGSVARYQRLSLGRFDLGGASPLVGAIKSPYPAVSVVSGGGQPTAAGENKRV